MTKAKNWAIVVGVNAYKNIGRLEYANRDAEAMHDFFVKAKFDRVFWFADGITLPSSSEQHSTDPTSSDLVDFLHDRFSTKVPPLAPGDNCWFFFAGHGKRIDDCDYLLPIDYNPRLADHEKRAISVNFVRERLLKSGADNVILLLDACRTEGDRADGLGIGDVQPGAITIFSCQRNRKAYEIEALRQGAFTAALLEALQMPGERNCATVERLDLYLQRRVPQICKQHQKPEQVPATYVEPRQKSYLILLPEFATDQDVALLRSEAQEAELEETLEIAEQLWIRVIAATQGQDLRALQAYARVLGKKNKQRSDLPVITITQTNTNHQKTGSNIGGGQVMTGCMVTNNYAEALSMPALRPIVQSVQVRSQNATNHISDLQEYLDRYYLILKSEEDALDTESVGTRGELVLRIQRWKREVVEVEKNYTQRLAQQIKRQELPESIAQEVVSELVDEIKLMQPIARTDEMESILQQILDELQKPGIPASARLKVAIPIIPNIVSYEIDDDTETMVRRLFPTFVKAFEGMR